MTVQKTIKAARQGFTLIELLIVMAILGVLAVVVLLAINPQQQLARTRDTGRISAVTQIGHAMQAYSTSNEGEYPAANDGTGTAGAAVTWDDTIVNSGELATVPAEITATLNSGAQCAMNMNLGWCYDTDGNDPPTEVIVFSLLEADTNINKCVGVASIVAGNETAYAMFNTHDGRGGVYCMDSGDGEPTIDGTGAFVDGGWAN